MKDLYLFSIDQPIPRGIIISMLQEPKCLSVIYQSAGMRRRINLVLIMILFLCSSSPCAEPTQDARNVIELSGVKGGLIVHIEPDNPMMTAALRVNGGYVVRGLTTDRSKIDTARVTIDSIGQAGPVSMDTWSGRQLPFSDNFVNLLICEPHANVDEDEVLRVLVPGGVTCTRTDAGWTRTVKPRSARIDEWSHFLHGPDNNPVADDLEVDVPGRLQWMCGPAWSKHHEKYPATIPIMVTAGGRLFYLVDRTPAAVFDIAADWWLVARDALNGVKLWERRLEDWSPSIWNSSLQGWSGGPVGYKHRIVASAHTLFIAFGSRSVVEATTRQRVEPWRHSAVKATACRHIFCSMAIRFLLRRTKRENA